jgi:hypothetical protein
MMEERLHASQLQSQATQAQLNMATHENAVTHEQLESAKSQHAQLLARASTSAGELEGQIKELSGQVQELRKFKVLAIEQQAQMAEAKQQAAQAQTTVLTLQEQRKVLQSENIDLKEELEHLYKHQQMLTTLQQQQQHSISSHSEPKLDVSIMEALKKQNRLIEDKCRMLQDNSMKMMKDFAIQPIHSSPPILPIPPIHNIPLPQSPDISGI